jgi:membrane protease YdiL (CAAX protease family)
MVSWGRIAVVIAVAVYALLGLGAFGAVLWWRHGWAFEHPAPWLPLEPGVREGYSLVLGLAFGTLVVVSTRVMVKKLAWAQALHAELRPVARAMTRPSIIALALASAIGEELFFRGLLEPWLGLVPQALVFGIVHQLRGPSRWVWVAWATVTGLLLGAVFHLSGSLVGPMVAHALINGLNLDFMRRHDPQPPRRSLGGLLGQRS